MKQRTARRFALAVMLAADMLTPAFAGEARRSVFGALPDGREVAAVTLSNANGVSATIIAWGAALQSVILPDANGEGVDVQLGYPTMDGYLEKSEYFGATVGRFANRIAAGKFVLGGETFQTPVNNGENALHGGTAGFDKALWEIVSVEEGDEASVTFRLISEDGDQGYPGTLTALATYALDENDQLTIRYEARTDKPTIVNLSNHAYWNLAGEGAPQGAMEHVLLIPADHYTPVDASLIPTGEFRSVEGTAFDFRAPKAISARARDAYDEQIVFGRGYDHNFVISKKPAKAPRLVARVEEPESGRSFELWSDQPGLQFYSGNFLDGTVVGKSGRLYRQGDALVLEPQLFPDTPNQKGFGSARLNPGETYANTIIYRFFYPKK